MLQPRATSQTGHRVHVPCGVSGSRLGQLPAPVHTQRLAGSQRATAKRSGRRAAGRHAVTQASAVAEAPPQAAALDDAKTSADALASGAPLPPPQRPQSAAELPAGLQDVTAVLAADNASAPGGRTLVYVLGMSHVSRRSVEHVDQLIRMVQPEVVMVELCKDRVTALVDRDAVEMTRSHCARVKLSGVPARKGWPTEQQLLALMRTRPGEAVAYQDIEEDPSRLLSTGLFKSCRPVVFPPKRAGEFYPTFLRDEETGAMKALRPIGAAEFILAPRQLPPIKDIEVRIDSSLRALDVEVAPEALEQARTAALEAATRKASPAAKAPAAGGGAAAESAKADAAPDSPADEIADAADSDAAATDTADASAAGAAAQQQGAGVGKLEAAGLKPTGPDPTVDVLMALRADLLEAAEAAGLPAGNIEVLFQGTDSSRVEAVLRAVPEGRAPSVSGLESTAPNGDGEGIEPFRPQPRLVEIGLSMRVPLDKVAENLPPRPPPTQLDALTTAHFPRCRTPWRRWTQQDAEAAEEEAEEDKKPDPSGGVGGAFASLLTSQYAKFQDAAGLTVGVETGEAWRAAFRAASDSGAALLLLGDRPSGVTARRMGDSIFGAVAPLFGAACAASLAADVAAATGAIPDGLGGYAVLAGLAAVGASLLPVIGPILEVRTLSKLPAEGIEAAAAVPEPLQNADGSGAVKLWGEDALLAWPGAMGPVIDERDVFMAKALVAAATGSAAVAPALAADTGVDGAPLWRYVMGGDGPMGVSPPAEGDGRYEPLPGVGAVVAVVGTAHVRGIIRAWGRALQDQAVAQYVE